MNMKIVFVRASEKELEHIATAAVALSQLDQLFKGLVEVFESHGPLAKKPKRKKAKI